MPEIISAHHRKGNIIVSLYRQYKTIPSTLTPGTYYIGAIVDYRKVIKETNEGNNSLIGNSITIQ